MTKNGISPYLDAKISAFLWFLIGLSLADMLSPIVKPYDKNEKSYFMLQWDKGFQ